MRTVETVVIGGGPAGSSCAWELTRRGRECVILERQDLPKTKLCAGWITPAVLRALELGPGDYPLGLARLRQVRVHLGTAPASVFLQTFQYSIRRIEFDNWLLRRSGAEVIRHAARALSFEDGWYLIDGLFRCRFLVGAGGTNCPVKRGFFGDERGRLILTQEVEYPAEAGDRVCTLFYPFGAPGGYGWYVPKRGAVNIGYGVPAARLRRGIRSFWDGFTDALRRRRLIDRRPPPPSSHPYYVGDRRKDVRRANAFIVGDAAGLATADLGEGIGPAVESGLLAARDILGGERYTTAGIPRRTLDGLAGRALERLVGA